jgi:putative tricarboxylic transport membrane protein
MKMGCGVMNLKGVLKLLLVTLICFSITACSSQSHTSSKPSEKSKDDYPSKEVNWIIPFSPGSGADTFARVLIKVTEKHLGQKIIPINKEGGSTAVGVSYVLSQEADGYTLFSQSSTLPLMIASGQVPFSEKDLKAISQINADYKVLAVNAKSDIKTFEDFVNYAKQNPGKVKIGGVGTKSWSDVFASKILKGNDLKATYIPYDGGSNVVAAILGENLDAAVLTSSNINAQVEAGEIRMLAVSLSKRESNNPDVPTFKELGYENIEDDLLWRGVFGKAGIPEERVKVLNEAFQKALKDPEWLDYMEKEQQMDAFMESEPFEQLMSKEITEAKDFFKQ